MKSARTIGLLALTIVFAISCGSENGAEKTTSQRKRPASAKAKPAPQIASVAPYKLVRRLPHDTTAFTQGLEVYNGMFLESTGQNGSSGVRRVDIMRGTMMDSALLDFKYFGEGITVLDDRLYMLTYRSQTGFMFNAATLKAEGTFRYLGEGWGLANDGALLYMSNGTSVITVRSPQDFHIVRTINVTRDGRSQSDLNELEWIEGELWANIWKQEILVRIDTKTGVVKSVVNLAGILPAEEMPLNADVLNGIAYDSATKAIYVTGKNWPWMYQIEVD